jgi:catechol 2,3-dioxygenase
MQEPAAMTADRKSLGHVHLKVRDLDRSVDFYSRIFALRVTERIGGQMAFLSGDGRHHEIALQALGPDAPEPDSFAVGLYHVAFEVADKAAFARAYRQLEDEGIETAAVDHRISWAMYFADPDGNGLEIYCDTRGDGPDHADWRGHSTRLGGRDIAAHLAG